MRSQTRLIISAFILAGIICLLPTFTQAQPFRMSIEERVKFLKDSLKLTAEQTEKITKILEAQQKEMTALREKNQDTREKMRGAMQESLQNTNKKIKAVLDEKQLAKYEEMIKQREKRMERRMRNNEKKPMD